MLRAVPSERTILAARVVQRFQNTPMTNTAAIGGAMNDSTDWKTLKRSIPFILSTAMVIMIEIMAPTIVTICPMRDISFGVAFGLIFFT